MELPATTKLREQKRRTFRTGKKLTTIKSDIFQADDKKKQARNELLVKELALSSGIEEVKISRTKARGKKHDIPKTMHQKRKSERRDQMTGSPISETVAQKRASIALPSASNSRSLSDHEAAVSPTLLTAVGLLLDQRNHFEKDSNALTLAKVLLDKDKNVHAKHATRGSYSPPSIASQLGGLSSVLRFLNDSLSQESKGGERKSTIHTELINPTELGLSILKLLFGHKAPLVTKPTYKPFFYNNPTSRISPATNPLVSSSNIRLASQMKQFDRENGISRKKHHKASFSFALAKAVSDIIKSMAKEELKNYLQKMHNQPKLSKQVQSAGIPQSFWPPRKKVDVQGNRKSWVLLKIPKSGEEIVPQQTMADEPLEGKETETQKSPAGVVDTLGKLNDADPLPLETNDRKTEGPSKSGINNGVQNSPIDIKSKPTSRVGYNVRILPSLKGSTRRQPDSTLVNETPVRKPQSSAQTTAAFAEAVKKLLQAVQSSIKTLQGKQLIGHPQNIGSIVSDNLQNIVSDHVASIVSDQPKVPEKTNTGSVRGISNDPAAINDIQLIQKQPVLARKQTDFKELYAFTRAAGQSEPVEHENTIFDPLKDMEPITKSISPTKRLGPTGNVLFESATELGTPRDRQETSTVNHIQEGTFNM